MSAHSPGRALQAKNDDLEVVVLRFCIRPLNGTFVFLAIMDIRRALPPAVRNGALTRSM